MSELREKTLFAIEDLLLDNYDVDVEDFFENFSIQKLKDLCGDRKFFVGNLTDGFPAFPDEMSIEDAIQFMEDFPKQYESQGYYRTSRGEAIPPTSVRYELIPFFEDEEDDDDDDEDDDNAAF
jgi:hypothetical protein